MRIPFGTYTMPRRLVGVGGLASAGIMESSIGSASVAPRPRSTVRRGIAFLVIIMILISVYGTGHFVRYRR